MNEDKQLFHCVFGRDVGTIIRYSDTHVRPRPGDVVVARYIVKRDKDNKALIKILDIEIDNSREISLVKTVEGTVQTNINEKGKKFGFVEDYYIPEYLLNGVDDGDVISVKVILDGDKWRAVSRIPQE